MACAKCPYTKKFDVLWRHETDPELMCVMLRCCSGPELRILRGADVLRSEIFKSPGEVKERAAELATFPVALLLDREQPATPTTAAAPGPAVSL